MDFQIREIRSPKEVEDMIDTLEYYLPASVTVYNMLLMMKSHKLISPRVYTVDSPSPTSVCIVTQKTGKSKSGVAVFCCPEETTHLESTLKSIIKTSMFLYFSYVPWYIVEAICSTCIRMGFQQSTDQRSSVYIFPPSLSLRSLSEYTLGVLRRKQANVVYKSWPYRESIDWNVFEDSLGILESSSLYKEDSEMPVAWAMEDNFGQIGRLYTIPEHRRKGLASTVLLDMFQKHRQQGLYPYTVTDNTNLSTRKLFNTLGLQRCFDIEFLSFRKNI